MKVSRPLFSPRAIASHRSESMLSVTLGSIVRPCVTRQVASWITTVHWPGSRPDRSNRITASTPVAAAGSKTCGSPSTAADAVVGWKVVAIPTLLGPSLPTEPRCRKPRDLACCAKRGLSSWPAEHARRPWSHRTDPERPPSLCLELERHARTRGPRDPATGDPPRHPRHPRRPARRGRHTEGGG